MFARHADARLLEYRRDGQYLMPPTCWRFIGEIEAKARRLRQQFSLSATPTWDRSRQGQDRRGSSRPRCERRLQTACQAIRVNVVYLYQCL